MRHLLITAERKFWRCVQNGESPLHSKGPARLIREHEGAKADLKRLVPEDAKEATGHGLRAKRSKSGAISLDLIDAEAANASLQ